MSLQFNNETLPGLLARLEELPHQIILFTELQLPLLHLLHLARLQVGEVVVVVAHGLHAEGGEAAGGVATSEPRVWST